MINVIDKLAGQISACTYTGRGGSTIRDKFRESIMRRRMIEALTYPRILLLANLDVDECPQNQYFNHAHEICQQCEQGEECHWLNCNDHFSVMARKPLEMLYGSLMFCIDYVGAESARANHNVRRCACESCDWVRKARRLAWEYTNYDIPSQSSVKSM